MAIANVERILLLHAVRRYDAVNSSRTQMVHYTSAEIAFSIIRQQKVWMRNAIAMNDYSEIEYGERCLKNAWEGVAGAKIKSALAAVSPQIIEGLEIDHDRLQNVVRFGTYLTCLSEHDPKEDLIGRLSMWRAYGGNNGVALVIDKDLLFASGAGLFAYSSPVAYLTIQEFGSYLEEIADKLTAEKAILQLCSSDSIRCLVLRALRFAVLSTKHPGFREEAEWRVIYTPDIETSPLIEKCYENVGGVPQIVHKVPIRDLKMIKRVLIGPTRFPRTLRDAFVDLLTGLGVSDASSRVYFSDIPLRR